MKEKKIETYWLGDWCDGADLVSAFDTLPGELEGINVLLAYYSYENYSGEAFVLFEKEGKLYEVGGSHCSCYGLEGQWEPEEAEVASLRWRIEKGSLGKTYSYRTGKFDKNIFAKELLTILEEHEKV